MSLVGSVHNTPSTQNTSYNAGVNGCSQEVALMVVLLLACHLQKHSDVKRCCTCAVVMVLECHMEMGSECLPLTKKSSEKSMLV